MYVETLEVPMFCCIPPRTEFFWWTLRSVLVGRCSVMKSN